MHSSSPPRRPNDPFDVVACINLRWREDRWEEFVKRLPRDWPFARPRRFPAVDGKSCPPPEWWKESAGAWGCYRSHLSVIEDCLNNGRESVLILEDDAVFPPEFTARATRFLQALPEDWQMLYLGGQLLKVHLRPPLKVNDEVYRPYNVNRNHAWALRGEGLRAAYRWLSTLDWYANYHVDHHLGRLHERGEVPVYAPRRWLVGQLGGASDISGQTNDTMFWNHPEDCHRRGQSPLSIVLGSPEAGGGAVARALLRLGMFLGDELGGEVNTGGQATSVTRCQAANAEGTLDRGFPPSRE